MYKAARLIFFCQRASLLLKIFTISLDIFHHQIFACQLIVVWKVVDYPAQRIQTQC